VREKGPKVKERDSTGKWPVTGQRERERETGNIMMSFVYRALLMAVKEL
jgi:hypothetical protein